MAEAYKNYSMFDLANEFPNHYVCVSNYDAENHTADYIANCTAECIDATLDTFEGTEIFYCTPFGGYVSLTDTYDAKIRPGTRLPYIEMGKMHYNSYVFFISLMDGINMASSTAIFLGAVSDDHADKRNELLNKLFECKARCTRQWIGDEEGGVSVYYGRYHT